MGLLTLIISWVTVITGIFTLFEKASDAIKEESKTKLAQWIMNVRVSEGPLNWPSMFAVTFDSVFTTRHFSWACFWRSSVASLFAVFMVVVFVEAFSIAHVTREYFDKEGIGSTVFVFILAAALCNLIPDYISLLETRAVIRWMSNKPTVSRILLFIIIDILATNLIYFLFLFYIVMPTIDMIDGGKSFYDPSLAFQFYIQGITFSEKEALMGVFIYSTFFTSLWVWLYAFSGFLLELLNRFSLVLEFFKLHLAIENRPLRAMGLVLVLITTFGYLVGGLLFT